MIQELKDLMKIEIGKRKLIALFAAYFTGIILDIAIAIGKWDYHGHWFWVSMIFGLFAGFNLTSKMISFKKSKND